MTDRVNECKCDWHYIDYVWKDNVQYCITQNSLAEELDNDIRHYPVLRGPYGEAISVKHDVLDCVGEHVDCHLQFGYHHRPSETDNWNYHTNILQDVSMEFWNLFTAEEPYHHSWVDDLVVRSQMKAAELEIAATQRQINKKENK